MNCGCVMKPFDLEIEYCPVHHAAPELLEALKQIVKGEGPYSQHHLQHAENAIEAMKELARAAIVKAESSFA